MSHRTIELTYSKLKRHKVVNNILFLAKIHSASDKEEEMSVFTRKRRKEKK